MLTMASDFELIMKSFGSVREVPLDLYGTKRKPLWLHTDYNMQKDGPLAEIAITPSNTFNEFNTKIKDSLDNLNYHSGSLSYTGLSSYNYNSLSEHSRELGCSPSFDVYSLKEHKAMQLDRLPNFRTAGGHLHVDFKHTSIEDIVRFGKSMDLFLGAWSILVDPDKERRSLYGKAGDLRIKKYGAEYRTLSNFWVFNEELRKEVWERTEAALNYTGEFPDNLAEAINTSNKDLCKELVHYDN